MSAQNRTIKLTPGAKAYYPDNYYKRVGYQKSEASSNARVDALGQRVRDRFNEDVTSEYEQGRATGGGLQTRTLKQLKQAHTAGKGGPASQVSRQSDVFTKNKMQQQQRKAAAAAAQRQAEEDGQSVITLDRLRKFNDIQGTVAGNVTDEIAAANEFKEDLYEVGQGEEGCGAMQQAYDDADADREEERDEVLSQQM